MELKKVLIVDNDLMFLALLRDIMVDEGCQVRTAKDGKIALEEIRKDPPDILFTDLIMPKISGEDVINYVKNDPALEGIVIVLISGALTEYAGIETLGADYCIEKADINTVTRRIREVYQNIVSEKRHMAPSLFQKKGARHRKIVEELLVGLGQKQQVSSSMKEGLVVYDFDHKILEANPASLKYLGKPLNALLNTPVDAHFDPSIRETVRRILKKLSKGEEREYHLTTKFGGRVLDLHFAVFEDEKADSRPGGLILIYDLTKQKSAERKLEKNIRRIERLNSYINASASVASLLLKGGDIRSLVHEVLAIMGRAAGATRCYWFENHEDDSGSVFMSQEAGWCREEIEKKIKNTELKTIAYGNGLTRWYREFSSGKIISGALADFDEKERAVLEAQDIKFILAIPIFIRDEFRGFVGFANCIDETPWQEAEVNLLRSATDSLAKAFEHEESDREIQESESRYRDIFENISDFWFLHDMEGRFLEVNPAFERASGYAEKELLSMSVREMIPDRYKDRFDDYLIELNKKGTAEGLVNITTRNGKERVLGYRNWLVELPGGEVGVRGLVNDVTDRIKLEAQLRHAQRMESVGTIAGGISHNFRNILTGIMANTQLLQMKYKDIPELQKYANEIVSLTKTGSELIADLLQFSRKDSKDPRAIVNVSEILKETHHMINRSFDKKIDIRTTWAELLPIYGERTALSQVFMNMCTNARDAMPDGGVLSMDALREGDNVAVRISDTGCGMDEEIVKKVFDPFFTTKKERQGTGLGLSTSYGIVKDHRGEIKIETQPGRGTCFTILFPLAETAIQKEERTESKIVHRGGEKVLVVDDDETLLEVFEELLTGLGCRVNAVDNGEEAINEYKSWHPDIVLLDRNMPGMDGLTTSQEIFSIDPDAKIVLVSGYEEGGSDGMEKQITAAIKGYVTKPFDIASLSEVLSDVINA